MAGLPIKGDAIEARKVHALVLGLAEAGDARLAPHLPRLAAALVAALGRGTELLEGPVGLRAAVLLRGLEGRVPPGTLEAALAGLSEAQRGAVATYMAGNVPE